MAFVRRINVFTIYLWILLFLGICQIQLTNAMLQRLYKQVGSVRASSEEKLDDTSYSHVKKMLLSLDHDTDEKYIVDLYKPFFKIMSSPKKIKLIGRDGISVTLAIFRLYVARIFSNMIVDVKRTQLEGKTSEEIDELFPSPLDLSLVSVWFKSSSVDVDAILLPSSKEVGEHRDSFPALDIRGNLLVEPGSTALDFMISLYISLTNEHAAMVSTSLRTSIIALRSIISRIVVLLPPGRLAKTNALVHAAEERSLGTVSDNLFRTIFEHLQEKKRIYSISMPFHLTKPVLESLRHEDPMTGMNPICVAAYTYGEKYDAFEILVDSIRRAYPHDVIAMPQQLHEILSQKCHGTGVDEDIVSYAHHRFATRAMPECFQDLFLMLLVNHPREIAIQTARRVERGDDPYTPEAVVEPISSVVPLAEHFRGRARGSGDRGGNGGGGGSGRSHGSDGNGGGGGSGRSPKYRYTLQPLAQSASLEEEDIEPIQSSSLFQRAEGYSMEPVLPIWAQTRESNRLRRA
eukprot:g1497.t1